MRILVIDDDANAAECVARMLRGHEVVVNVDACQALELVNAQATLGKPFDLVVCDSNMPKFAGVDVLRRLLLLDNPPMFVLMSGDNDDFDVLGCDATIGKPFRRPELIVTIERAVHNKARATTRPLRPFRYAVA